MANYPREFWVSATDRINHVRKATAYVKGELDTSDLKVVVISTQDDQAMSSALIFAHLMKRAGIETVDIIFDDTLDLNPSGTTLNNAMNEFDALYPGVAKVMFCNDNHMIAQGVDSRTRGEIPIGTSFGPGSVFYVFLHDYRGQIGWGIDSYDPNDPDNH